MIFQIETTTVCNAACVFCVHKTMKRAKMHMQPSIFEKTITDIARVSPLEGIILTGLGETLLDPDILDRIKLVRCVLKDIPITIYTNGTNLKKYLDELMFLDVSVMLSMNSLDHGRRKSVMGIDPFSNGDFEDILERSNDKFTISSIVDWGLMDTCDKDMLKEKIGKKLFLHLAGNWAGKLYDLKIVPISPCGRMFGMMFVLVDGRVSLCCLDSEGDVILGNNIIEALQGSMFAHYQEMHQSGRRSQLELCRNCTTI